MLAALIPLLLTACASSAPQAPVPEWAGGEEALEAAFPDGRYIKQKGRGDSAKQAETAALSALSRYFLTGIRDVSSERVTVDSEGRSSSTIDAETFIRSEIELFALRYTDPWLESGSVSSGKWETVAYIDRNEAWINYEPKAQKQADAFTALFAAAENERDPLKRFFAYRAAEQYTASSAYSTTMEFGQKLAPEQMNSAFAEVRARVATIPQRMNEAKKAANIFVALDTDNEGALNVALAKALGSAGWAVAKSRAGAAAICAATVTEGIQKSDMSTFYFPKISITLRSASGGDVFSCSIAAEKQGAVNPDIAKLRAYTALAAAVEKQFSVELNK
ncbi:hypothetical protein FACS1894137_00010 [Spirochaetia bacterium]|nr:hypothetical protein FACS1894137_00010 [Spirochaetia bacterium]